MARVVAAFAVIYVVWGSTYLAIRFAVATIPPLLAAGARFLVAGLLLLGYARLRSHAAPTSQEWRGLALVSLCLFVLTYGPVFWAEKYLASGLVSVLTATVPLSTLLLETFVFRHSRFSGMKIAAALIGFLGVAILMWQSTAAGVSVAPAVAVLFGATSWSLGSVLSRSVQLPKSKIVTAGGEMLAGGLGLLVWSALAREWYPTPQISPSSLWALLYLIVFGSLLAFTAFVWLLARMPASSVSSYAYVNPVIAVLLGYMLANEPLTGRTAVGSALVVGSVALTLKK